MHTWMSWLSWLFFSSYRTSLTLPWNKNVQICQQQDMMPSLCRTAVVFFCWIKVMFHKPVSVAQNVNNSCDIAHFNSLIFCLVVSFVCVHFLNVQWRVTGWVWIMTCVMTTWRDWGRKRREDLGCQRHQSKAPGFNFLPWGVIRTREQRVERSDWTWEKRRQIETELEEEADHAENVVIDSWIERYSMLSLDPERGRERWRQE